MISKYAFVANNKMYNRYILFYLLFIEDIFSMIKRVRILKHTQVIFSSNLSSHLLFQLSIFLLQIFIDNFGLKTFNQGCSRCGVVLSHFYYRTLRCGLAKTITAPHFIFTVTYAILCIRCGLKSVYFSNFGLFLLSPKLIFSFFLAKF